MLFETENLSIGYKSLLPILRDLNLKMEEGEMVALIGANGSGKTTFVRTIAGLLAELDGKVHLGKSTKISIVPQMKNLKLEFPMTLKKSLSLSQSINHPFWKTWKPSREEEEILERTGMVEILDLLIRECSGGQLQKFLIARSLLSGANLIFLDEPMDALDHDSQDSIMDLLYSQKSSSKKGFFMITHNIAKSWLGRFDSIYKIDGKSIVEVSL